MYRIRGGEEGYGPLGSAPLLIGRMGGGRGGGEFYPGPGPGGGRGRRGVLSSPPPRTSHTASALPAGASQDSSLRPSPPSTRVPLPDFPPPSGRGPGASFGPCLPPSLLPRGLPPRQRGTQAVSAARRPWRIPWQQQPPIPPEQAGCGREKWQQRPPCRGGWRWRGRRGGAGGEKSARPEEEEEEEEKCAGRGRRGRC
jgi:hypothetical protein